VVISDTDFQLLFADDVFLWPVCVILPIEANAQRTWGEPLFVGTVVVVLRLGHLLDDLALLDDAFDFFHDERTDPH
jgi:hypothetical protein